MKRRNITRGLSAVLPFLCLCLVCSACGGQRNEASEPAQSVAEVKTSSSDELPQPGESLCQALHSEHMDRITSDLPILIELRMNNGWDDETMRITDPDSIKQAVEALTEVTIKEEIFEVSTDNYNGVTFQFSDGQEVRMTLNRQNLEIGKKNTTHYYELENFDSFWKLVNQLAVPQ